MYGQQAVLRVLLHMLVVEGVVPDPRVPEYEDFEYGYLEVEEIVTALGGVSNNEEYREAGKIWLDNKHMKCLDN